MHLEICLYLSYGDNSAIFSSSPTLSTGKCGGFRIIPSYRPSGWAIHVPQISMRIFGGISMDHPSFFMISPRRFRGNEGDFSMWIFPPPFPVESLEIFPRGNFPRASPKNFKMKFNDIGRVPVMWKYPSDDLMSLFGELKCLQVWGNFPLISTAI